MKKSYVIGIVVVVVLILIIAGFLIFSKKTSGDSEYDACIQGVQENDQKIIDCISEKIKAKGYNDTISCLYNPDVTICLDNYRYNAEVDANNYCVGLYYAGTMVDCSKLVGN